MVYSVSRHRPGDNYSVVVIETASRQQAYKLRDRLQKRDPDNTYGVNMAYGESAGEMNEGPREDFVEYVSKEAEEILGRRGRRRSAEVHKG